MAARAAFCVRLVIRDAFVTGHAGCAIGSHLGFVNVVACRALAVAVALRCIGDPVKTGQLGDFVTATAAGLGRYRAAVRFVTTRAVLMTLRAPRDLFVVTAPTGHGPRELVSRSLVTSLAGRMP